MYFLIFKSMVIEQRTHICSQRMLRQINVATYFDEFVESVVEMHC